MQTLFQIQNFLGGSGINDLVAAGIVIVLGFYLGKTMRHIRLPSIIGYMIVGLLLGPSLFNLISESRQEGFSFITDIALGFVALSIGLELRLSTLKQQGRGMIVVILMESFMAFLVVATGVYLLTKSIPIALVLGAIAPASAPAGTVAVIQEYRAKGPLTSALYSVVGFDDGLCIIIFGFASAIAKNMLMVEAGGSSVGIIALISPPLIEIGLSILIGGGVGTLFCLFVRRLQNTREVMILLVGAVLIATGICIYLHLSLILTNMIMGMLIVNTQSSRINTMIREELNHLMPLLFVLFFALAGSNLHLAALPSLGILGTVYILTRSAGLISGATLGAHIGRCSPVIRNYLGLGILSQAGVAIGLALVVQREYATIAPRAALLGSTVITTITATCIFFEILGPILARIGLKKAGELGKGNG